jgi:hypothetical protein
VRCWELCQKGKSELKELLTAKSAKNAAKSAKRSAFTSTLAKKKGAASSGPIASSAVAIGKIKTKGGIG